jgi:hypothetical protein
MVGESTDFALLVPFRIVDKSHLSRGRPELTIKVAHRCGVTVGCPSQFVHAWQLRCVAAGQDNFQQALLYRIR